MSNEHDCQGSEGSPVAAFMRVYRLSPQEGRLIEAALRELSNEDIARELGCSPSTIRTYWSRIFHKVGCSRHQHVFARITRFILSRSEVRHVSDSLELAPAEGASEDNAMLGSLTKAVGLVALLISSVLLAGDLTVAMDDTPRRNTAPPEDGRARSAAGCANDQDRNTTCQPPNVLPIQARRARSSKDFRSFQGTPIRAGSATSCRPNAADGLCYGAPLPSASSAIPREAEKPAP